MLQMNYVICPVLVFVSFTAHVCESLFFHMAQGMTTACADLCVVFVKTHVYMSFIICVTLPFICLVFCVIYSN